VIKEETVVFSRGTVFFKPLGGGEKKKGKNQGVILNRRFSTDYGPSNHKGKAQKPSTEKGRPKAGRKTESKRQEKATAHQMEKKKEEIGGKMGRKM